MNKLEKQIMESYCSSRECRYNDHKWTMNICQDCLKYLQSIFPIANKLQANLGEAVNLIPHDIDNFMTMQCSPNCRACRLIKKWQSYVG
jgi:hypothetical protein